MKSNLQIQCSSHQIPLMVSIGQFSVLYGHTHANTHKTRITKTILNNKITAGSITIPYLKLYYRDIVIKAVWYWHKNTLINGIKDPDINPHTYGHLLFGKEARNTHRKKAATSTNSAGCRRIQIDPYFSSWIKLNCK